MPLKPEIAKIEASIAEAAADGKLTIYELWKILLAAVESFVRAIETVGGLSGAEKKAAVMGGLEYLYDKYFIPIDLPGPDAIMDPPIKMVCMAGFSAAVEWVLTFMGE